jgi:Fe2+ transport system protein FeoA
MSIKTKAQKDKHWRPVPGSECLITDLGGDAQLAQRLAQMGVLPDSRLRVVRLAPLGNTVEVSVEQGELLALRMEELTALGCDYLVLPLSQVALWGSGRYRITRLAGGRTFRERMQKAGLQAGGILSAANPERWPLEIHAGPADSKLQLGRGEAEKILVERIDGR